MSSILPEVYDEFDDGANSNTNNQNQSGPATPDSANHTAQRLRQLAQLNIVSSSISLGMQLISAAYIILLLVFRGLMGAVQVGSHETGAGLSTAGVLIAVLIFLLIALAINAYILLGFWDLLQSQSTARTRHAIYLSMIPASWSLCGLQLVTAIPAFSLLKSQSGSSS